MTITRKELIEILNKWENGDLTEKEIFEWASNIRSADGYDVDDWEGDEENSVANEIIAYLDMMDLNLVTKDDVGAMKEFLSTPIGSFINGYNKWESYNKNININQRKNQLIDNELYNYWF